MESWLRQAVASVAIPVGLVMLSLLGACAFRQPNSGVPPEARSVWPAPGVHRAPVVGLVLSGGSARGYAHIGVIRVLDEAGIRPDVVVGTSAGSIVGAVYASGASADDLVRYGDQVDWSLLRDLGIPRLGFIRGDRVRALVNDRIGHRPIEAFPIRFAAVATDFRTGELVLFNHGDAGLVVQASSSIPGIFEPVAIGERLYVDGGLVSPLPISCARKMGATFVIAVDVIYPARESLPGTPLGALWQSFLIQTERIKELEKPMADIVIAPRIRPTDRQYTFSDREHLMLAGQDAAREALPAIRALLKPGKTEGNDVRDRGYVEH